MTGGDQFLAGPHTYAPRYDRWSTRTRTSLHGYAGGITLPPFGYSWAEPPSIGTSERVGREAGQDGRLLLHVTPGSAQVFVDGFYMGVVDDFTERGLWLEAGSHRIELRADSYESTSFDVRVAAGQTVDYERSLARAQEEPRRQLASAPAKAFYVIPRCYAGDSIPRASQLPAGCSTANLRTIPPQLNTVTR